MKVLYNETKKDYCDRCQKFIDQIDLGNGSFGCPICKCDDSITTFYTGEEQEGYGGDCYEK